jgi:MerR family copper efflux transcriptional regulator
MNISDVSAAAGLPVKTIRYYEDVALITPQRPASGYRVFSATDTHKLTFLARGRSLGFPVESCRSLLALYNGQTRESADGKHIASAHLDEIDQKLVELAAMRNTLAELVHSCAGESRPDCPILKGLAKMRMDI